MNLFNKSNILIFSIIVLFLISNPVISKPILNNTDQSNLTNLTNLTNLSNLMNLMNLTNLTNLMNPIFYELTQLSEKYASSGLLCKPLNKKRTRN